MIDRRIRIGARCILFVTLLTLSGCSTNIWQASFEGLQAGQFEPLHPSEVTIREVPWERLEPALVRLRAEVATSDIHPDEWPEDRRRLAARELLTALQVSEPIDTIKILGRSEFRTTDTVRPNDGSLARWAGSIGADRVVWSSHRLGRTDRINHEPVTTFTWGNDWFRAPGERRVGPYQQQSTTWVPVKVQADELSWVAYFLRRQNLTASPE